MTVSIAVLWSCNSVRFCPRYTSIFGWQTLRLNARNYNFYPSVKTTDIISLQVFGRFSRATFSCLTLR